MSHRHKSKKSKKRRSRSRHSEKVFFTLNELVEFVGG